MAGLREKQKEDRKRSIVAAARKLFMEAGYEGTTIDGIAEEAGLSGVTVHNYYGTKSGVLMAVVADSDRELLGRIDEDLSVEQNSLTSLLLLFAGVIHRHAVTHLDKSLWRQVIASSVSDSESRFSKGYISLDHKLAMALVSPIEKLQAAGKVNPEADAYHLAKALFQLQNGRFIQFISFDELSSDEVNDLLVNDMQALLSALPRTELN